MQKRLDAASRSAEHFLASVTEVNANEEQLNHGTGDRSQDRKGKFCARMQGNGLISQQGDSFHRSVDETCRWLFTDFTDLLDDILHDPLSVDYFNVYLGLPVDHEFSFANLHGSIQIFGQRLLCHRRTTQFEFDPPLLRKQQVRISPIPIHHSPFLLVLVRT